MTQLRQKMLEELQRRNYSHRTAKTYIRIVREFAEHFHRSPDKLGPEQIRQYQAHLFQTKKLAPATVSQRMMIRIHQGKGRRDRDVPLSPKLLETLRVYWRWMKPQTFLFPGTVKGRRADVPISPNIVWLA